MPLPVSDELLILAYQALEARADPSGLWSDFSAFRSDWVATHVEDHGPHTISFWRGPETEAMVLLTEGRPAERTLASVDHRPGAREPSLKANEGTFLQPGTPFHCWGPRLASFGIFAGWWPCEPGARRLRLARQGEVREIGARSDGFILIDWSSPAPVDRFEAVEIEVGGWVPTALPLLPYTGEQLLRSYARMKQEGIDWSELNPDLWAYELFSIEGDLWFDAVVELMRHADPERDYEMLLSFGAHIYANGHAYYDRMERELQAGTIDPGVLRAVLSMERPEFMNDDLRARHLRLKARCR